MLSLLQPSCIGSKSSGWAVATVAIRGRKKCGPWILPEAWGDALAWLSHTLSCLCSINSRYIGKARKMQTSRSCREPLPASSSFIPEWKGIGRKQQLAHCRVLQNSGCLLKIWHLRHHFKIFSITANNEIPRYKCDSVGRAKVLCTKYKEHLVEKAKQDSWLGGWTTRHRIYNSKRRPSCNSCNSQILIKENKRSHHMALKASIIKKRSRVKTLTSLGIRHTQKHKV